MKPRHIVKYTFFLVTFAACTNLYAQVKPTDKAPKPKPVDTVMTEEIEVVRAYRPVLADAVKIRRSPDLDNKKPFKPQLSYNIIDNKFELNRDIKQLQAQELKEQQPAPLKNNYVKIGAGNLNTGVGEIYLNTGRDEALQAGLFFKHLSQEGDIDKQKLSRQQAGVFGRSIMDQITLNGEAGFDRLGTYFYGIHPNMSATGYEPAKQRLSTLSLKGELLKNYTENESEFSYAAKADAYFFSNYATNKENTLTLSGFLNKAWNKFNFGVNTSLDLTATKDSVTNFGNSIFRLNPYAKFQGDNYKLIVGINFVQEFGDISRTNLLPAIIAEVPVVPGYATLFAGYSGDVSKTSLRDLSYENPYLVNHISISNALEKSNIYGGIKGNAGSGFGFKASVFYKNVEDLPLFVHSKTNLQKFDIVYDTGSTKILGFDGEISVNASETFNWTGKITINNYKTSSEREAWYKPTFRLASNAKISISKKFNLDGELVLNGDTKAKTYTLTPTPEERIVSVKSYVDLSAGADYLFRDKIGVFLRVNNILGNEYERFLYYPKFGLNILGGFNYSF